MAKLNEIRSKFIDYFIKNNHEEVQSSPLVPMNDPTLMFTNSGMVQFKNVFTGDETRDIPRAVTSQKCVRAGGKHNDLDNVGYTARHHTFFEMLGNFSFGDYFKERAIPLAWDLVTKEFGLPKEKLLVTVFHDDDEAVNLWKSYAGINENKIIRINTSDNFWSMGPTGPCGPCSEIFYDHGDKIEGGPPGSKNEDGDRFVEIWNLVFMQFYQMEGGLRENLPKPSIDTGMGLERMAAILQGKHDNYDTDLMRSLIEESAKISSTDPDGVSKNHHRVISDHLRSAAFLIADGVMPSSEGRGYVLRRILRRAMRHGNLMNINEPFIHKLVGKLVDLMGGAFPELNSNQSLIEKALHAEESKFITTLDKGLSLLESEIRDLGNGQVLDGKIAFKLYDTFGFPLDLTQDALREKNMTVDLNGYEAEMKAQKERARNAWSGSGSISEDKAWLKIIENNEKTEFLGYDQLQCEGLIMSFNVSGSEVSKVKGGETAQMLCNQTPFFGESGGQVGDKGVIESSTGTGKVENVFNIRGFVIHEVAVTEGEISVGQTLKLSVEESNRFKIRANHSATHILHEALRNNLGQHVEQRGSLNSSDRLRFDFSHNAPVSSVEIEKIQNEVNTLIRQNSKVETNILDLEKAKKLGARALFGEKYDHDVRVVSIGKRENSSLGFSGNSYSVELCGGTHVNYTGDIGYFIITAEVASSGGVRRIEALTGQMAIDYSLGMLNIVTNLSGHLRTTSDKLLDRVDALLTERKLNQQEISNLKIKLNSVNHDLEAGDSSLDKAIEIKGIKLLSKVVEDLPIKDIRSLLDKKKSNLKKSIVIIFSKTDNKVMITVGATLDLEDRVSAVDIARLASKACGGQGGGGRTDFAQAGGSNPSGISAALEEIAAYINSK
ncbi:MAG: alanine--tRNA ligase [Rhodobacteraceae bacterium]|nr:MAG: alanine--tRNA ligase [Paracoccaceae bacterium]